MSLGTLDVHISDLRDELQPDYTDHAFRPRHRRWGVIVASVGAAVLFIAAALVALRGTGARSTTAGSLAVPDARQAGTPLSAEEGDALLQQQMAAGWVPYGGVSAVQGVEVPAGAWVKFEALPKSESVDGRIPVYDAPDGQVIGYAYSNLGFVPKEIAESGQFDAAQARIAKFGCDIKTDQECRSRLAEALGIATP